MGRIIFPDPELAEMLRQLIIEHKKRCKREYCGVQTSRFAKLYEVLKDSPATVKEIADFM